MLSICALSLSLSLAGCGSGDAGPDSPIALAQADTASAVNHAATSAADEKAVTTDWTARVRDFIAKMKLEQVVSTGTTTGGGTAGTGGTTTGGAVTNGGSTAGGGSASSGGSFYATTPVTTVPGSYTPSASGGLPANVIRIQNPTTGTIANVPLQVGRVFRKGEVPTCPAVFANGVGVQAQVDVKNRWPDGSLKFAVVSMLTPQMSASQTVAVEFRPGGPCANTGTANASSILGAFPDFDAQVKINGGAAGTASARQMIQQGAFKTWTNGPVSTTLIVEDHATKRFDFGPNTQRSLRPVFHVTFWHGTGKVNVRTIVEQSDTTKLGNLSYGTQILSGLSSPAVVYSKATVPHTYGSRWTRTFWVGGEPTPLNQKHDVAYLASTYAIPNLDASITFDAAKKNSIISSWNALPAERRDIYGTGFLQAHMPNVGGRGDLGLFTDWQAAALYDGDHRLWQISRAQADLGGAWPMHFREGESNRNFMKTPVVVNGLGRPITKDGRPGLFLYDTNQYMNNTGIQEAAGHRMTFVGAANNNNWNPDCSHQPDLHYVDYLVSGDYWLMEQAQFWASWSLFITHPGYGWTGRVLEDAEIGNQLRGEAWCLRSRARTAWISADGTPESQYFNRVTDSAIKAFEGMKIGAGGTSPVRARWATRVMTNNPLHYWRGGGSAVTAENTESTSVWQYWMMISTLGHLKELGFPTGELLSWAGKFQIGMMFDPGSRPEHMADYNTPMRKKVNGSPLYQTWADAFDDWEASGTWRNIWGSTLTDLGDGYATYAIASGSFLYDEPGGVQAWNWLYTNGYSRRSYAPNPKWAFKPR